MVQDPREAFSKAMRFNTALTRRRSLTDIAVVYMSDIVRPDILTEVERRL